jgi:hypothetical protein
MKFLHGVMTRDVLMPPVLEELKNCEDEKECDKMADENQNKDNDGSLP